MSTSQRVDLAFLTSLPHRVHVGSYERRLAQLEKTVGSVGRQTNPGFGLFVVTNEPLPERLLSLPQLTQIGVEAFGPASSSERPSFEELWIDKGAKLGLAATKARNSGARYVMPIDSDDLINCMLAESVQGQSGDGWYSEEGFILRDGYRDAYHVAEGFHMKNGSTHLMRASTLPLPDDMSADLDREAILEVAGKDNLISLFGAHTRTRDHLANLGQRLEPLSIPSAIWLIGTGDNYSRQLNTSGRRVALAGEIQNTFGVEVPSLGKHATASAVNAARRISARVRGVRN